MTHATVKEWIRLGKLAAFRTPGGHARVPLAEFERFKAAHAYLDTGAEALRLLIVDDDDRVASFLGDALRAEAPQLKVETAGDGYEGLLKVGTFAPHLLILDIRMPRLDGLEVCRRIKASPDLRATKVILITGAAEDDTAARARECGADAFLTKPILLTQLRSEVGRLLGPAWARANPR